MVLDSVTGVWSIRVTFKSFEQEQAVNAVVTSQTSILIVLPTGRGKSLLVMVPECLDNPGLVLLWCAIENGGV